MDEPFGVKAQYALGKDTLTLSERLHLESSILENVLRSCCVPVVYRHVS